MTYEYACEACGHQWEAEQSIKDAPLKKCAACGKEKAKRLVSGGTGFLLKGGGWYADLYSSSNKSGAAASSGESPASAKSSSDSAASKSDSGGGDAGAKSPASAESKPAKPAETKASSAPST
jgi:putative FmdB family regulatory protein